MKDEIIFRRPRTDPLALQDQVRVINESPLIGSALADLVGVIVILNDQLEVVGLNDTFIKSLGIHDFETTLGLRLGECIGCINAAKEIDGCGTGEGCRSCGAVIAMMTSLNKGVYDEQICALTARKGDEVKTLSLLVRTSPVTIEKEKYIVLTAKDVTQEQVRANLERVFYHDINNMLTVLLGACELLNSSQPDQWEVVQILDAAKRIEKEIALQRDLSLSKITEDFQPDRKHVQLSEINDDIELLMRGHVAARGRTIEVLHQSEDCLVYTDKHLVSRVLANMLINALEATATGGIVKFSVRKEGGNIIWEVWNNTYIEESIQARIFQRYFSTKSKEGRGVGAFSMKLFGENYLQGRINFQSSREEGTVFSFSLPLQL